MNYKQISIGLILVFTPLWSQSYIWPVNTTDEISSPFGPRNPPDSRPYDFHSGIDIGAVAGTAVKAVFQGKVAITFSNEMYVQIIQDDTLRSAWYRYMHVTDMTDDDQLVSQGENIAKVEADHLDIRFYINPPGFLDDTSPYHLKAPWERDDLRVLSWHPLRFLPFPDSTPAPTSDPNYVVGLSSLSTFNDTNGDYLEHVVTVDDQRQLLFLSSDN